jgi:hypothetical protein
MVISGCTTFQSIALTPPAKTVFGQGEEFSSQGLQVTGLTKKGEIRNLSGNARIRVSGYNPDRPGEQTIVVDYRGIQAVYTVTVVAVESIAVDRAPPARQGVDLDRSGLRVTAFYGDRIAPRPVEGDRVTVLGYDKDRPGEQTLAAEYYGKSAAFTVNVAALSGLRIERPPTRLSYFPGDALDLEGLELRALWEGAGDAPVSPEYVTGFDTNRAGDQTVIVEALGLRISFKVTVKEPVDPAQWTPAQGAFARNITGLAYGNGTFVALGHDDRPEDKVIAYSRDGVSWTRAAAGSSGLLARNMVGLVYGNGTFVAAGHNDDGQTAAYNDRNNETVAAYSRDGISWTRASVPARFKIMKILFARDRFVALGSYEYLETGNTQRAVSYYQVESSDGVRWSDRNPLTALTTGTGQLMDEAWGSLSHLYAAGDRLIALYGAGRYLYSGDQGRSWTAGGEGVSINGRPISAVASGRGRMVGVGPGNALGWSMDGLIWTDADQRGEGLRGGDLNAAAFGFGLFVAAGDRGNILYSRDGYAWTRVASSTFGSTGIRHLAYGGGRFVASGDNGRIAYSNKVD